jgi:hypothetical protein
MFTDTSEGYIMPPSSVPKSKLSKKAEHTALTFQETVLFNILIVGKGVWSGLKTLPSLHTTPVQQIYGVIVVLTIGNWYYQ